MNPGMGDTMPEVSIVMVIVMTEALGWAGLGWYSDSEFFCVHSYNCMYKLCVWFGAWSGEKKEFEVRGDDLA